MSLHPSIEVINHNVKLDLEYVGECTQDLLDYLHDYATLVADIYPNTSLTVECEPIRDDKHLMIKIQIDKVGSVGGTIIDFAHPETWPSMDQEKYFLQLNTRTLSRYH